MSLLPLRKMTQGALTLPSVEYPVIYEDPVKSIHTRKYEPVNIGDVEYLVRDCPDRFSEAIMKFPRAESFRVGNKDFTAPASTVGSGIVGTPTVGGGSLQTTSGMYGHYGNPYKVDKFVRPPMLRPTYDLLPLSRMKRPNTSVSAQAHFPYQTRIETMKVIDFAKLKTSVWSMPNPDLEFVFGDIHARPDTVNYINDHLLMNSVNAPIEMPHKKDNIENMSLPDLKGSKIYTAVGTNPNTPNFLVYDSQRDTTKKLKDAPLISVLRPGFEIAIFDSTTRSIQKLPIKLKDKVNFAVATARHAPISLPTRGSDGPIKLKDYNYMVIQTAGGSDILTIDPRPMNAKELARNIPHYFARTNLNDDNVDLNRENDIDIRLSDKEAQAVMSNPSNNLVKMDVNSTIDLRDRLHPQAYNSDRTININNVSRHHALPTITSPNRVKPGNPSNQAFIQWPNHVSQISNRVLPKACTTKIKTGRNYHTSPNYTVNPMEFVNRA